MLGCASTGGKAVITFHTMGESQHFYGLEFIPMIGLSSSEGEYRIKTVKCRKTDIAFNAYPYEFENLPWGKALSETNKLLIWSTKS